MALHPVKTSDIRAHPTASDSSQVLTRSEEVEPETALLISISLSWRQEEEFHRQTFCATRSYIHSLRSEDGRNSGFHLIVRLPTQYFKQTNLLGRIFFSVLKKTFTKLKGNQNSNLKNENKTMQRARWLRDGGQSSASCWAPAQGHSDSYVRALGTARTAAAVQRLIFPNNKPDNMFGNKSQLLCNPVSSQTLIIREVRI